MITATEAGLTQEQWDALNEANESAVYRTVAHRWNPVMSFDDANSEPITHKFDACLYDDTLYYLTGSSAFRLNAGTWESVSGFSAATDMRDRPYSLISEGGNLHVFAITDSGISYRTYDGSSWSSWTEILTDDTVTHAVAVTATYIHYITRDIDNSRYRLKVLSYSGSWSTVNSDIHYPYPIYSFDAVRFNGRDILVLSTEVPGNLSAKFVNNTVVKYTLRAGGIIGFIHQYGSWSDHFEIDLLDEINIYRFRESVRLSVIEDRLFLTCFSGDGDATASFSFYREYTSKDGRHFSRGELLPGSHDQGTGAVLCLLGDTLYWLYSSKIYKGTSTLRFAHSPSSQQLDFSDEVSELRISRQDMQQLSMTLDTSTNWLVNSILNGQQQVVIEVFVGYLLPDEEDVLTPTLVKVGTFELDSIVPSLELPGAQADLTARDFMAWMVSRTQAEQFKFWEPQTISGDNYTDDTTTGYGGMGHTAVQTGSWRTDGSFALKLISNNSEGIAWNTIVSQDNWNGILQHDFQLASLGNNEYAGLVFRAQDTDNLFIYAYYQEVDKVRLIERVAGSDTTLWESSTLGWSSNLNVRYLRLHYYYCQIRMFTSTDGITWTLQQTYLVEGKPSTGDENESGQISLTSGFIQSGFNGLIGYGYSDEAEWADDPGPFPVSTVPPDQLPYYADPIDPLPIGEDIPWEAEFNFLESLHGWSVHSSGGAVWAEGIGVYDAGGSGGRIALVERSFGTPFIVTGIKVEYRTVSVDYSPTHYARYRGELSSSLVNEQNGDISTTNGAIRIYTFEDGDIVEDTVDYLRIGAVLTPAGSFQSASVRLRKITVYGKGYYPF